jgi:pyruvate kinase
MMDRIVVESEAQMLTDPSFGRPSSGRVRLSISETICESMAHAAEDLDIAAIAVFTETGTTARQLSKWRPKPPIYAMSSVPKVIHRMNLLWGVHPVCCAKFTTTESMIETAEDMLTESGYVKPREILGIVAGTRTLTGSTNFLRLHVLGDRAPGEEKQRAARELTTA